MGDVHIWFREKFEAKVRLFNRQRGWEYSPLPTGFLPLRTMLARSKLTEIVFYCKLKENLKQMR